MSLAFFTDPHLGVQRSAHTTTASRQRLQDAVFQQALNVLRRTGGVYYNEEAIRVCLGDLFDQETNPEHVILQGLQIAGGCHYVMAGNHDLPNRHGKASSYDVLSSAAGSASCPIHLSWTDQSTCAYTPHGTLFLVPHKASQELFDEALNNVYLQAPATASPRILCLHCNYDSPFVQNDASLNITAAQVEHLLTVFDYVLLGHEHQPRKLHDGRLIILGNTHPTSFSDISDKFYYIWDGERFTENLIWSKADGYREIQWDAPDQTLPDSVQFVNVVGNAPADQQASIAAKVVRLWKTHPNLLMVRSHVVVDDPLGDVPTEVTRTLNLPDRVSAALEGTDLQPLWHDYLGRLA